MNNSLFRSETFAISFAKKLEFGIIKLFKIQDADNFIATLQVNHEFFLRYLKLKQIF